MHVFICCLEFMLSIHIHFQNILVIFGEREMGRCSSVMLEISYLFKVILGLVRSSCKGQKTISDRYKTASYLLTVYLADSAPAF